MYHKFISDGQNQTVFFLSPAMFIFDPRMITVVTIWTDEHEDSKNINFYIFFFDLSMFGNLRILHVRILNSSHWLKSIMKPTSAKLQRGTN